jgi:hypothetical protein
MSVPVIQSRKPSTPYYLRKIRCPRHFIVNPKEDPFIRELVPELKRVSESAVKSFGVKKYRIKKDRYGVPMRNWKAFHQPEISAAFAIHQIWDPQNIDCQKCRGRCMEGKDKVNEMSIKRLHG